MVLTILENYIDKMKNIESLEFAKRHEDPFMQTAELVVSYRKSDRARWALNALNDALFLACKNFERKDDGSKDVRTDEQKRKHQECFGLMARIR